MLRNGYQSWSPSGVAVLGVDVDPSTGPGLPLRPGRPPRRPATGPARRAALGVGDRAGRRPGSGRPRAGRLRRRRPPRRHLPAGRPARTATSSCGPRRSWATPCWRRARRATLHAVVVERPGRTSAAPGAAGARGPTASGRRAGARTEAPFQVGWCSWYQYFHDVTEADIAANLARADRWPFEVFQLDDGYQAAIGDWLATNDRFPSGLDGLAASIDAAGLDPGPVARPVPRRPRLRGGHRRTPTGSPAHWSTAVGDRRPLRDLVEPAVGRRRRTASCTALDTTHPDVVAHLEARGREPGRRRLPLPEAGLHLRAQLSTAVAPTRRPRRPSGCGPASTPSAAAPATTPSSWGAACRCPTWSGVVDANRIGPDVAPLVVARPARRDGRPATSASSRPPPTPCTNTLARAFMHRRLWLNDPDCLMLRTERHRAVGPGGGPHLGPGRRRCPGGMALVSDDLALLDPTPGRCWTRRWRWGGRPTPTPGSRPGAALPRPARARHAGPAAYRRPAHSTPTP